MKVWNALSFDIEDWYHIMEIPSAPPLDQWGSLTPLVETNTRRIFDLIHALRTDATFFFLGWIAERFPGLVEETRRHGHEIGSHGYGHELVFKMTRDEFSADVKKSAAILEGLGGRRPQGYRAPGFSITRDCEWAFDCLEEAGFTYDSSVFPAQRLHGGLLGGDPYPHRIALKGGKGLDEFPISTLSVMGKRIAYSGGGYLRLFPLSVIHRTIAHLNARGIPVIVYVHPRELDPDHPRLSMSLGRAFRSYFGLRSVIPKLKALLSDFPFTTVRNALDAALVRR